jgi:hypothetical protein
VREGEDYPKQRRRPGYGRHGRAVNNFLHSLFSQLDVLLNSTLITSLMNAYAYIETLLSYGADAKTSQFTSALFYEDEAGKTDKPDPLAANAANRNSGLASRLTFAAESHEIDMIERIHTDICFQDRY